MNPLAKHIMGQPVTLLDKARTCASLEELEGFTGQLRKSRAQVSEAEWAELADMKIRFQQQE